MVKKNGERRKNLKAVKQRRKAQEIRKYKNRLKSDFSNLFGQDAAGFLFYFAGQMKPINKKITSTLKKLDCRSGSKDYKINDIIWTTILMFFLREGSRNQMNNLRKKNNVKKWFKELFDIDFPHMDTCNGILVKINPNDLREIFTIILKYLLQKKLFEKSRYFGRLIVIIDGTGIGSVEADEGDLCPKPEILGQIESSHQLIFSNSKEGNIVSSNNSSDTKKNIKKWATGKTSKNGDRYFTRSLILLNIVGPNGLTITVDWEEINTDDGSSKEDCEQNAAKRLLKRFKDNYKRLKVILVIDGLYTNQTFMQLAEDYNYLYIYTLKDDSLKNLWKEIDYISNQESKGEGYSLLNMGINEENIRLTVPKKNDKSSIIDKNYKWINGLSHKNLSLSWCALSENIQGARGEFYFSIVTNIVATKRNIIDIMTVARSRNLIEDAFNRLKNRGYNLKHKFSRTSDYAAMNYITLMSIADSLFSIIESSDWVQGIYFKDQKDTIISLITEIKSRIRSEFKYDLISNVKEYIPKIVSYTKPTII